ncbi:TonB-dependent receptor plug domain-containing protein [Sphingomonas arenae]|uniref:TonB-dependent receptor plug domain-containing protein n=1 Tax=Sphingomonas arenae TaxID=2812555 RepID=UPI0019685168|nr:TonB-dependent receptor [Sphingomonas arenae]
MPDLPIVQAETAIVVTASRAEQEQSRTPASVTLMGEEPATRLGEPLLVNLLRLTPSASIASTGPAGSQSQIRLRGAEANHTLLFIDGIRANDPAAGNEPRFELLNADMASRVEVIRGPQSALWGSEAIGGVVAVGGQPDEGFRALGEAGSFGFGRIGGSASTRSDTVDLALAGGYQAAEGINAFDGGPGDRDGYRNAALRGRVAWRPAAGLEFGASAFGIRGRSEFDGFDPVTFLRADTLDETRNRLAAGRVSSRYEGSGWTITAGGSHLRSSNRNLLDSAPVNRTRATRTSGQFQLERQLETGRVRHTLIAAIDADRETFRARDVAYGGFTDQDRDRAHQAFTAEWRAETGPLVADLAIRRDVFNRFQDTTTLRASALAEIGSGFSLAASYGEGIAQPTFFDLYGFFPGSFVGNPSLAPERSRGVEASLRLRRSGLAVAATVYRQRLKDEIIDVFDPVTFLSTTANADGRSKRSGLELEAGYTVSPALRLSAQYAYLDAEERTDPLGRAVKEVRRPKHSGAIALDGTRGRLTYGASLAYTGTRTDRDFDQFPAAVVRLDPYWLAGARVAWRVTKAFELFGRVANAFDADYQDVVGYRTEGRSAYAGLRLGLGG